MRKNPLRYCWALSIVKCHWVRRNSVTSRKTCQIQGFGEQIQILFIYINLQKCMCKTAFAKVSSSSQWCALLNNSSRAIARQHQQTWQKASCSLRVQHHLVLLVLSGMQQIVAMERKELKPSKFNLHMLKQVIINALLPWVELTRHRYPSRASDGWDNSTSEFPRV